MRVMKLLKAHKARKASNKIKRPKNLLKDHGYLAFRENILLEIECEISNGHFGTRPMPLDENKTYTEKIMMELSAKGYEVKIKDDGIKIDWD